MIHAKDAILNYLITESLSMFNKFTSCNRIRQFYLEKSSNCDKIAI